MQTSTESEDGGIPSFTIKVQTTDFVVIGPRYLHNVSYVVH